MIKISDSSKNYLKFILTFGTATASFKTAMISNHICWDGCCFSDQNKYEFLFETSFFCHLPKENCCNLPVVRVIAIPKRRTVVLRVILQPSAKKVLTILYKLDFQFIFVNFRKKKITKRIGNFYICSKKENTKTNASLPKSVSEQTDKMPPFILFYSEK